jgi:hypothetical protein
VMVAILEFIIFAPTFLLILMQLNWSLVARQDTFISVRKVPLRMKGPQCKRTDPFSWPLARDDGYLRKGHC